ncbi:MAG: histidinol-phosphatase [Roseitalea sp.]|uniref:Histidinol-phosphatase n=2 Tax=Oceaniradius stylonematis TaxID=2184161 RepID=A0A3A8AJG8_9HYPH|nr:histidinol-phosphatase [Oceaniradius stylonematis]MBO6551883.1 histidinol-phosphatase [Roseitalea sp.]MBO6951737.1 histidinol-phosphatase [Rhizobiaceae bacterium]RNC95820.1 MAG: histidinol-phosphatase [Oricola sp.]MBO6592417.1 histidinol-phosphatase [Roseitalea sp.]MBO6598672.1 histidinol-phosphatase [Roseitalea sp.]
MTMTLPDRAFLEQLARAAAAETLPRFRMAGAVANKLGEGFDPVTEADRAAEAAIRALIGAHHPDHGIIGEEYGSEGEDRSHVWVIDPIDGTRAYISGLPVWGTLVGLTVDGVARSGFMHQPFTDELFVADGSGTFLLRGGADPQALETRKGKSPGDATLFTTTPALYEGAGREAYDRLEAAVRLPRYGCDCYGFAMVAAGHADIAIEPGLAPYDICALIPLIEQAGGVVTRWDGGRAEQGGDVIAAGSAELHEAALELLDA